jgi:hypothetical protein
VKLLRINVKLLRISYSFILHISLILYTLKVSEERRISEEAAKKLKAIEDDAKAKEKAQEEADRKLAEEKKQLEAEKKSIALEEKYAKFHNKRDDPKI